MKCEGVRVDGDVPSFVHGECCDPPAVDLSACPCPFHGRRPVEAISLADRITLDDMGVGR